MELVLWLSNQMHQILKLILIDEPKTKAVKKEWCLYFIFHISTSIIPVQKMMALIIYDSADIESIHTALDQNSFLQPSAEDQYSIYVY